MTTLPRNEFLHGPLGPIYARTALPIILVMAVNGLLTVVDALFLGHYVGAQALAAVTLMFPIFMLIVALATLVASGMSSHLARHLGGERFEAARAVFAAAHGLALLLGAGLIVLFAGAGARFAEVMAGGNAELAALGLSYLRITVLFAPLMFVLAVNSDALRNEGRVGFMAAMSVLVSLANIGFDYVFIARMGLGVAGSAWGTVAAQALAFGIILGFRLRGRTRLGLTALVDHNPLRGWGGILALGAPQSLSYVGISLGSVAIVSAVQIMGAPGYGATIAAYGVVTRVITFSILPLLGLAQAMQTITGNNHGAQNWRRSDNSLRIALVLGFGYCALMQAGLWAFAAPIGGLFVADERVVSEVARIMPMITALFCLTGPLMITGAYFQAIGDPVRAAILGLAKPFVFSIPLILSLHIVLGEVGIWLAGPTAEALNLGLTALVLCNAARRAARRWGVFFASASASAGGAV
ncbi:MATE family efflux transporter [Aquicoccus sp. G2-2]|uniref:MATE family efflux transporter n=1 Tax=Aquicoccus sp. G2-2 TaxID=3092120 RepID=UPI002ADFF5B3|nr:MATE family efflux transporter [Aquicoccus sp. G2-2]MEA1113887.1 MATE family efflux transporter [Aquicoccus sp. G2-2]